MKRTTAFRCANRQRMFIALAWVSVALLGATPEQPYLVRDLIPGSANVSSVPDNFVGSRGRVLFSATSKNEGHELWITDGTAPGTHLLRDISPGAESTVFESFHVIGEQFYFIANSQLWTSDGTAAGTLSLETGYGISAVIEFQGRPYFIFDRGQWTADRGLWTTDGTPDGTKHVCSCAERSSSLVNLSDQSIAIISRFGILKSNGIDGSTEFVLDGLEVHSGVAVVEAGGSFFFSVSIDSDHTALWKSDGTTAGTEFVKAGFSDSGVSLPHASLSLGNKMLIVVREYGQAHSLWISDGTADGTVKLADRIESTGRGSTLAVSGGLAFFAANDAANGTELWVTDGTPEGTNALDVNPGSAGSDPEEFVDFDGTLFFSAQVERLGRELWASDGTAEGTQLVAELNPGTGSGTPWNLGAAEGALYFADAIPINSSQLWKSEGTSAGAQVLFNPGMSAGGIERLSEPTEMGGAIYYNIAIPGSRTNLFRSDGTEAGTYIVKRIDAERVSAVMRGLEVFRDQLFFESNGGSTGPELWVSDGSEAGTRLVIDLAAGRDPGVQKPPVALADMLLFAGRIDPDRGLWRTDGTAAGTQLLRLFPNIHGFAYEMLATPSLGFFIADGGEGSGFELWRSDGTVAGTHVLKDIYPGSASSSPRDLLVLDDRLYFHATSPEQSRQIWGSDGSEVGTRALTDLPYYVDRILAGAGEHIFNEGLEATRALWATNRKTGESIRLLDLFRSIDSITRVGNRVFFAHDDGIHGYELWVSDGSLEGTLLVSDIEPGKIGSRPAEMSDVDGRLIFKACTLSFGCEVWTTDGTESGTRRLTDLAPGAPSSNPSFFAQTGRKLIFYGYEPLAGRELFAFDLGVCGDFAVDPLEECDDGNAIAGDGCSESCQSDASWVLYGRAQGGAIELLIEGIAVSVSTFAGQSASEAVAQLADAAAISSALRARGVSVQALGPMFVTDGLVADLNLEDLGLSLDPSSVWLADLDIRPGDASNSIQTGSHGVIPVALLGSEEFDVGRVDVPTLAFGPDGARSAHRVGGHLDDVNGDGLLDLISHFRVGETGIEVEDRNACLTGDTLEGRYFESCDAIQALLH